MANELQQLKDVYMEKLKRLALIESGADYGEVDNYIKYLTADTPELIAAQADELLHDVKQVDNYADPSQSKTFKPFE